MRRALQIAIFVVDRDADSHRRIDEHRGSPRCTSPFSVDNRIACRRQNRYLIQTDLAQLIRQPCRTPLQVIGVLRLGADTRETDELLQFRQKTGAASPAVRDGRSVRIDPSARKSDPEFKASALGILFADEPTIYLPFNFTAIIFLPVRLQPILSFTHFRINLAQTPNSACVIVAVVFPVDEV